MGWGLCLIVAAFTAQACLSAPAAAKSSRGIAFLQGSLTVGWKQLEAGKKVRVCNGGRTAAQLDVRLAGFGFRHTDAQSQAVSAYRPRKVLEMTAPSRVRAGRCTHLLLEPAEPRVVVDPGEYAGMVVAAAVGLGVIRQKLTILGPGQASKPATVSGAVDVQRLDAVNSFPDHDSGLASPDLLLDLPGEDAPPLALGAGCRELASGEWSDECAFIGNLYKDDDVIHVYVAGSVGVEKGVARLPIRIEGADAVGDYEGGLDPAGNGAEDEIVKVELSLTDSVLFAILALFVGAALGAAIKLWSGRWRLKHKLTQRAGSLAERYGAAASKAGVKLAVESVSHYVVKVDEAISRYSWSTLVFDTNSDGYKQIDGSLAKAEDDLRLLADHDGLCDALAELEKDVSAVEGLLVENRLVKEVPELLTRARALLEDHTYAVGDAIARSQEAKELGGALDLWCSLADRILGDEALLTALGLHAEEQGRKPAGPAQKALGELVVSARALHEELFRATGREDLERLRASGRLEGLHSRIAILAEEAGVERPEQAPAELLSTRQTNVVSKGLRDKFKTGRAAVKLDEAAGTAHYEPASAVEMPNRKFRLVFLDVLVLLAAASAAAVGGLAAFYFGKNWGTREDYLVVIMTGTASQLLITAVLEHFSTFMHDLAPIASATPAKVTVVSSASQ